MAGKPIVGVVKDVNADTLSLELCATPDGASVGEMLIAKKLAVADSTPLPDSLLLASQSQSCESLTASGSEQPTQPSSEQVSPHPTAVRSASSSNQLVSPSPSLYDTTSPPVQVPVMVKHIHLYTYKILQTIYMYIHQTFTVQNYCLSQNVSLYFMHGANDNKMF